MQFLKNPRLIAVVLVVAAILAFALWPSAIDVDLARVTRGPMQVTIDEEEKRGCAALCRVGTGRRTG
jgi:hypothetical protein